MRCVGCDGAPLEFDEETEEWICMICGFRDRKVPLKAPDSYQKALSRLLRTGRHI